MSYIFIHFSVDGHLGYFYVLAVVNSAAMKIGMHVFFQSIIFSRYIPRNGIAVSYGSFILVFTEISILFSIVIAPVYIPTNSVGRFPFLYTLSSIYCL